MGKDKLRRFAENETFANMVQPKRAEVEQGLTLKGNWAATQFKNNNPIILELGLGHGDYTVGLARMYPDINFSGVDIKGARMWRGAKIALTESLTNVAFLRTDIELIDHCFGPNEVSEIWITFPDPQIKFRRAKHRLVHPDFLKKYEAMLTPEGRIHLKCDSEFLHGYTCGITQLLGYTVHEAYYDISHQLRHEPNHILFTIKTYYEQKWLQQGKAITYLSFSPPVAEGVKR